MERHTDGRCAILAPQTLSNMYREEKFVLNGMANAVARNLSHIATGMPCSSGGHLYDVTGWS